MSSPQGDMSKPQHSKTCRDTSLEKVCSEPTEFGTTGGCF